MDNTRQENKVWLKGNLHMHTARSDGRLTYEDAVALYEQAGYDFIAVTDHWKVSEQGETSGGMLLLPGCEYNVGRDVREGIYHIVGVGMQREPQLKRGQAGLGPQAVINEINRCGGHAILAHPAWSLNSAEQTLALRGFIGTEIYNATSGFPKNARPYSGLFVDRLASMGMLLPCMACDDAHHYQGDALKGFIRVHAAQRTHAAIMQALAQGDFYASQGPHVEMTIRGGRAYVTCSPAESVVFYSDAVWSDARVVTGKGITQAEYAILPYETFIRVEVTDSEGRSAYSAPIRIK